MVLRKLFRVAVKPDHRSVLMKDVIILLTRDDTAAGSEDDARKPRQFLKNSGLICPKDSFAVREDFFLGSLSETGFIKGIRIVNRFAGQLSEPLRNG